MVAAIFNRIIVSVAILAQAILAQAVWFNTLTSEVGTIGKRWVYPAPCDIIHSGLFLLFRGGALSTFSNRCRLHRLIGACGRWERP